MLWILISRHGDDTKRIWAKLSTFLPVCSLFQSDRQKSDKDTEVQDPLELAVAQFFQDAELQETLNNDATQIEQKLSVGRRRVTVPVLFTPLRNWKHHNILQIKRYLRMC